MKTLIMANVEHPDWADEALCRRSQNFTLEDFFYGGRFANGSRAQNEHIARLKALCNACPVKAECDAEAEATEEVEAFRAGVPPTIRRRRRQERLRNEL